MKAYTLIRINHGERFDIKVTENAPDTTLLPISYFLNKSFSAEEAKTLISQLERADEERDQ